MTEENMNVEDDSLESDFSETVEEELMEETTPETDVVDDYFADDEKFLSDDTELDLRKDLGIFKQDNAIVTWGITNLYDGSDDFRKKRNIRRDPPVLRISSSDGDEAQFILTKDFTKSLKNALGSVEKAYNGLSDSKGSSTSDAKLKEKFEEIKTWVSENKIKTGVIGLLIVFVVVSSVFF